MSGMLSIAYRKSPRVLLRALNNVLRKSAAEVPAGHRGLHQVSKTLRKVFTEANSSVLARQKNGIYSEEIRYIHLTAVNFETKIVVVPQFPDSVSEGDVRLEKKVGDAVAEDDVVMEIETDKTSMPVPATASGVIEEIFVQNGDTVKSGMKLYSITVGAAPSGGGGAPKAAAEAPAAAAPAALTSAAPTSAAPPPSPPTPTQLTSAGTLNTNTLYAFINVLRNILWFLRRNVFDRAPTSAAAAPPPPRPTPTQPSAAGAPPAPRPPAGPATSIPVAAIRHAQSIESATVNVPPADPTKEISGTRTEYRVKMNRMRQMIAKRLKDAQNTNAMLTTFNEIDMSSIMEFRKANLEGFVKKYGIKFGFMSVFARACAYALQDQPVVNAVIDGQEIIYRDYIDISVAVATPKGLVVPVLRNVERMNYADIEMGIAAIGEKAKKGQLAVEDMDGGTFTISNGGVFGSLLGTPIINPPQSAILGMHGIFDRPIALKGQVVIRPMMYVALTYDHRLIDGREAVLFLRKIKAAVEDPRVILCGL